LSVDQFSFAAALNPGDHLDPLQPSRLGVVTMVDSMVKNIARHPAPRSLIAMEGVVSEPLTLGV
jgi:hypothetical protein